MILLGQAIVLLVAVAYLKRYKNHLAKKARSTNKRLTIELDFIVGLTIVTSFAVSLFELVYGFTIKEWQNSAYFIAWLLGYNFARNGEEDTIDKTISKLTPKINKIATMIIVGFEKKNKKTVDDSSEKDVNSQE